MFFQSAVIVWHQYQLMLTQKNIYAQKAGMRPIYWILHYNDLHFAR